MIDNIMTSSCQYCGKHFTTVFSKDRHIKSNRCIVLKNRLIENNKEEVTKAIDELVKIKESDTNSQCISIQSKLNALRNQITTTDDILLQIAFLMQENQELKQSIQDLNSKILVMSKPNVSNNEKHLDEATNYTHDHDICQLTTNLRHQNSNMTINNNSGHVQNNDITNTTNIQNLVINNYGQEDVSHITPEMMTKYVTMMENGIVEFVRNKHFNKLRPCNRNIRLQSKKRKELLVMMDGKWAHRHHAALMSQLCQANTDRLDAHYVDNEDIFKQNPRMHKIIDTFFEKARNNDKHVMAEMMRKMYDMILTETSVRY